MGLTATFTQPFYSGQGTSSEVPGLYPVALNGRPFLVDLQSGLFERESVPVLREQADTGEQPAERSLNPAGLWRRAQESWHKGAGQTYLDRPESDAARFNTSKGVNPWEKWELSLLPATSSKRSSANTNLALEVAGSYLYVADGTALVHTTSLSGTPTWTASNIQAGESATTVSSIASDGFYVYAALGANGIHRTERGAATASHYSDLQASLVRYVLGRLMAAKDNVIYNVTASGAAPSALLTHSNTDFTWVDFAAGRNRIYAAGYSGDKSLIYRITIKSDGTGLDVPIPAGQLPDGEIVRSIHGYLGFLLIGTDTGWRIATADDNGDLTIGARIATSSAVRCFEGQDRFVWFGYTNYDSTSTGLGRADLTQFNGSAPAYASDLMADVQGNVLSVATFGSQRVFAVSGQGVYAETSNKVSSGTLDTGQVTYGIPDAKVAVFLDLRHEPLDGTVAASISQDAGTFTSIGTSSTADSDGSSIPVGQREAERFELRFTLTRDSSDTTLGPELTRWTLRSQPRPARALQFTLPLILHEALDIDGATRLRDVKEDLDYLSGLLGKVVTYQEGDEQFSVILEDFKWRPRQETTDHKFWSGTCLVRLKEMS